MLNILSETISAMRFSSTITVLVDNGSGTYTATVTTAPTILLAGQAIQITNTAGFDDKFIVTAVSGADITFTMASGTAIPGSLGTLAQLAPFDDYATWVKYNEKLTNEDYKSEEKREEYPAIKTEAGFTTDENDMWDSISDITINFINYTELNKTDAERITESDYLKTIRAEFLAQLMLHSRIIDFSYNSKDFRNAVLNTDNLTNVISIQLTDLQFIASCT
jgi:hypothetical protein